MAKYRAWGEQLKAFRLKIGYTQEEFAELILDDGVGLSVQQVSRYENGHERYFPKQRKRHINLIRGLVRLGGLHTPDEANTWLGLGERGFLTPKEIETIFDTQSALATSTASQVETKQDFIGRQLGKYKIQGRLGKGGMAEVYHALHPTLKRDVAIKVIHQHLASQTEFALRFEQEAQAVADLRHPHIVQLFDFDLAQGVSYMVMEFIDGPTLAQEISKRIQANQNALPTSPFHFLEMAQIITALAGAIDYAHGRGVIHRDIKPENIMFTKSGQVLLTDFGIARVVHAPDHAQPGVFAGTPAYMSPEQAEGKLVDERSDIYTLTVILYELVTGQVPFASETQHSLLFKLMTESIPPPSTILAGLPLAVEQVIMRGLDRKPDNRYQTAGALAEALRLAIGVTIEQIMASNAVVRTTAVTTAIAQAILSNPQVPTAPNISDILPRPFQAPAPQPYFVGRKQERRDLIHLVQQTDQNLIIGLCGPASMGKTALATAFAHQVRDHFYDGILWIRFDENATANGALHTLAAAFGQAEMIAQAPDLASKTTLVRQILADKHLLLVLNNAEESDLVKPLLLNGQRNVILITTQNRKLLANLGATVIDVHPFSVEDGIALLKAVLGPDRVSAERAQAEEIIRLVGGLPLAISIIAGALAEADDLSITEYRDDIADEQMRLEALSDWEDESRDVVATFTLSYDRLSPPLQQLFTSLAVFDGLDFNRKAVAAITKMPMPRVRQGLNQLYARSLIGAGAALQDDLTLAEAAVQGRYYLHPLLHLFVREQIGDRIDTLRQQALHYFANLAEDHTHDHNVLDLDWENIAGVLEQTVNIEAWDALLQAIQGLTQPRLGVIGYMEARGYWAEAQHFLEAALSAPQVSEQSLLQARLQTRLGAFAFRQADFEKAEKCFVSSHTTLEELEQTVDVLLERTYLYGFRSELARQADLKQAQQWIEEGLAILATSPQEEIKQEAAYLHVLLSGILGRQGEFETATIVVEKALQVLPKEPNSARLGALLNLSNILSFLEETETCISFIKEGIEMAKSLRDVRRLATFIMNLGIEYELGGQLDKAVDQYQQAMRFYTRMGDIEREASINNNLASAYIGLEQYTEAQHHFDRTLELIKRYDL
ncbi:MAG: protein kinase, partial [Chloroflexota bacterium]